MEEVTHPVAVPFVGIPFLPTNASRTCVKPFSFEERNKQMLARKEEKIRNYICAEKKVINKCCSLNVFLKSENYYLLYWFNGFICIPSITVEQYIY